MPTANEATRKTVEDALYGRATARLDPRFSQQEDRLNSQLAAQGITQGSEAYNREKQNFDFGKNDAYSSATNDAITGSNAAMKQLYDMGMAARQQGVGEANTLRTLPTQEALAAANLNMEAGNDLRGYYGTELAQEQAIPAIAGQTYNAESAARKDALAEQQMVRNQILNELNALRGGSRVDTPSFQPQGGGAAVGAAPVAQSAYNSYQGDLNNYNAQVGQNNSTTGAIGAMAAAAITAY
jgi:hypothetical protein